MNAPRRRKNGGPKSPPKLKNRCGGCSRQLFCEMSFYLRLSSGFPVFAPLGTRLMLFGEPTGPGHFALPPRKRSAGSGRASSRPRRRLGVAFGRSLQLENLEDRRMMSVVPVDPPGQVDITHSATLSAAVKGA